MLSREYLIYYSVESELILHICMPSSSDGEGLFVGTLKNTARFLHRGYGPYIDIKLMIRHGIMIYSLGHRATDTDRARYMKAIKAT